MLSNLFGCQGRALELLEFRVGPEDGRVELVGEHVEVGSPPGRIALQVLVQHDENKRSPRVEGPRVGFIVVIIPSGGTRRAVEDTGKFLRQLRCEDTENNVSGDGKQDGLLGDALGSD